MKERGERGYVNDTKRESMNWEKWRLFCNGHPSRGILRQNKGSVLWTDRQYLICTSAKFSNCFFLDMGTEWNGVYRLVNMP